MAEYGRETVDYKDNKVDFSPFTEHEVEPGLKVDAEVKIGHMTGDRQNPSFEYGSRGHGHGHDADKDLGNYNQADNALAEKLNAMAKESNEKLDTKFKDTYTGKDIENYRNANNLTWHEKEDAETMQLVPTVIHDACRHTGGTAVSKNIQEYGSMSIDEFESDNMDVEIKNPSETLVNEADEALDEFSEKEEFDNTADGEISETEKSESDEELDEFAENEEPDKAEPDDSPEDDDDEFDEKTESNESEKNNSEVNGLEYNVEQREIDDPQARASFESYRTAVTTEELELYRIMDDRSNPNGSYWTTEKPTDRMNAKIDLALPPTWENEDGTHTIGNQRTTYEKAVLPTGTEIFIGTAALQKTSDDTELSGGGVQIYMENGMPDEYITEKNNPLTFHTKYKDFNEKAEKIEKESMVNSNEANDNK